MTTIIKIVDNAFNGQRYTNPTWKGNSKIEWDRSEATDNDPIVIYTDDRVWEQKKGKIKIAWLFEGRAFKGVNYEYVTRQGKDEFDYVLTWDKELVDSNPDKFILIPYGGSWIDEEDFGLYDKTKLTSIVASGKKFLPGHHLRHEVISRFSNRLDLYGYGYNPIDKLISAYKDYMFTIAIENMSIDYGFSEKIVSPMLCGSIPIYWGPDSIDQFFNPKGIIQFKNVEELPDILNSLSFEKYEEMLPYVKENFDIAKKYCLMENLLHDKLLDLKIISE